MAGVYSLVLASILIVAGGSIYFIYAMDRAPLPEDGDNVTLRDYTTTEAEGRAALEYVNELRVAGGLVELAFDTELYRLAKDRATDMAHYDYLAYRNPYTGRCTRHLKGDYGFGDADYLSESIRGQEGVQYNKPGMGWEQGEWADVVDGWMGTDMGRRNLLFPGHTAGALACERDKCVFLGLNNQSFRRGCY